MQERMTKELLEFYQVASAQYQAALDNVKKAGVVVVGAAGQPIVNPWMEVLDKTARSCLHILKTAGIAKVNDAPAQQQLEWVRTNRSSAGARVLVLDYKGQKVDLVRAYSLAADGIYVRILGTTCGGSRVPPMSQPDLPVEFEAFLVGGSVVPENQVSNHLGLPGVPG